MATITGTNGSNTLTGTSDNDVINANGGNDTVFGGGGDDLIGGGSDTDFVYAGDGDDTLFGGNGDDRMEGGADNDYVDSGDGNDSPHGGAGVDALYGAAGNDYLSGGDGNDRLFGGTGDDTLAGGPGADTLNGGEGIDYIDYAALAAGVQINLGAGTAAGGDAQGDVLAGVDGIIGSAFDDILIGFDNQGLSGDVYTNILYGGGGNDYIDGLGSNDSLFGGNGDDIIEGGAGSDTLFDGAGKEPFFGGIGDTDVLNLTGTGPLRIIYDPARPLNGTINYLDASGNVIGSLTFTEIENVVPRFTPGTRIETRDGRRMIEVMQVGDMVLTRDNGDQPVRWIGRSRIRRDRLRSDPLLQPILISRSALGHDTPDRDMLVSRQHRMLMSGTHAMLMFGIDEVLVRAAHLTALSGVCTAIVTAVTYPHPMFDRHEVVMADAAWSESFQPGQRTLNGIDADQRAELFKLFPALQTAATLDAYDADRPTLKGYEEHALLA